MLYVYACSISEGLGKLSTPQKKKTYRAPNNVLLLVCFINIKNNSRATFSKIIYRQCTITIMCVEPLIRLRICCGTAQYAYTVVYDCVSSYRIQYERINKPFELRVKTWTRRYYRVYFQHIFLTPTTGIKDFNKMF